MSTVAWSLELFALLFSVIIDAECYFRLGWEQFLCVKHWIHLKIEHLIISVFINFNFMSILLSRKCIQGVQILERLELRYG